MRSLLIAAPLPAALPAEADFLSSFGIHPFRDLESTREGRAGSFGEAVYSGKFS